MSIEREPLGYEPAELGSTPGPTATPPLRAGTVGLFDTVASTLANIAPALSIFLGIGALAATMGSRAPWAYAVAAVAILTTGNTMVQFARRIPTAGSFVTFTYRGFATMDPRAGQLTGGAAFYLLLIGYPISLASVVVFIGSWVQRTFSWPVASWIPVSVLAIAVTLPLLLRGIGVSVKASFLLFLSEALGLTIISVAVLAQSGHSVKLPTLSAGGVPGGFHGLAGITFAIAVFAFIGWENSGPLGEESRNPRRTVPLTIIIAVGVSALLFFLSAWAAVAGYGHWKGDTAGMSVLASGTGDGAQPFVDLARHYAPYITWLMILIGVTSSLGSFLAAGIPISRISYHAARAGLLPHAWTKVGKATGVPYVAVLTYVLGTLAFCILPLLILGDNPVAISADLAGVSTVAVLLVYALANISLPIFIFNTTGEKFSPVAHGLVPLIGTAVVGYGAWISIQPNQPAPANTFWIYALAMVVIAVGTTTVLIQRKAAALDSLGISVDS